MSHPAPGSSTDSTSYSVTEYPPPSPLRPEPVSHWSSSSLGHNPHARIRAAPHPPSKRRSAWRFSRSSRETTHTALRPSSSVTMHDHQPTQNDEATHDHFRTHATSNTAPLPFFHPTRAALHPVGDGAEPSAWNSRASRKNRYKPRAVRVEHHADAEKGRGLVQVEQRVRHPQTRLKANLSWDISWWVAVVFVLGSTAWVVNGFYLFLPLVSNTKDHLEAAAWWAFVGGTLFEGGAYLMLVESLNTGHEQLFGPALWGAIDHHQSGSSEKIDSQSQGKTRFRWIGTNSPRDLGFLASAVQMFAATIFWVSTITGLPGVISGLPEDPPTAITDVFYWTPQVIGGWGFIIASLLLMFEVQEKWWKPKFSSLGWHIAGWNLIGALGFMLCGALGYASLASTKVNYQSVLSTFWGSWAFLIGSVLQMWEALWREDPDA